MLMMCVCCLRLCVSLAAGHTGPVTNALFAPPPAGRGLGRSGSAASGVDAGGGGAVGGGKGGAGFAVVTAGADGAVLRWSQVEERAPARGRDADAAAAAAAAPVVAAWRPLGLLPLQAHARGVALLRLSATRPGRVVTVGVDGSVCCLAARRPGIFSAATAAASSAAAASGAGSRALGANSAGLLTGSGNNSSSTLGAQPGGGVFGKRQSGLDLDAATAAEGAGGAANGVGGGSRLLGAAGAAPPLAPPPRPCAAVTGGGWDTVRVCAGDPGAACVGAVGACPDGRRVATSSGGSGRVLLFDL